MPRPTSTSPQNAAQSTRIAAFMKSDLTPGQTIEHQADYARCRAIARAPVILIEGRGHLSALYQWRVDGV